MSSSVDISSVSLVYSGLSPAAAPALPGGIPYLSLDTSDDTSNNAYPAWYSGVNIGVWLNITAVPTDAKVHMILVPYDSLALSTDGRFACVSNAPRAIRKSICTCNMKYTSSIVCVVNIMLCM